jgi:flavin-binding protein dodecin
MSLRRFSQVSFRHRRPVDARVSTAPNHAIAPVSRIGQTGSVILDTVPLAYESPEHEQEGEMPVAKVSEISATSSKGFEDALQLGIARANKTLRNVRSAWVKEQQVRVSDGRITEYQVNMMVTFVIDD